MFAPPTAIYTPGSGLTQYSSTHQLYVLYLFSVIFVLIDRSCLVYVALVISLLIPLCLCIFIVFYHNYNRLAASCPYGIVSFILTRLYRTVFILKLMC